MGKNKKEKTPEEEKQLRPIPYGKAGRVGNYKIWRNKFTVTVEPTEEQRKQVREESGGKKRAVNKDYPIDCIYISTLDGSWSTKIPQTSSMYSLITMVYGEDDKDMEGFLKMVFGNMSSVCLISNEYLHDAFMFLRDMMQTPYLLLEEDDMVARMKAGFEKNGITDQEKVDGHINSMVEYRKKVYDLIEEKKSAFITAYEKELEARWEEEEKAQKDLERDEVAEQAEQVLNMEQGE